MPYTPIDKKDQQTLLEIARENIQVFLTTGRNLHIEETVFSKPLQQALGNYVRLILDKKTRGAVGNLQSHLPLITDVSQNAYDAAFEDPRFPPLTREEMKETTIEITLLTPPEPIICNNEQELRKHICEGEDGLLLAEGVHSSHLLPSDWHHLPDVASFMATLKKKAGLPTDYWSDNLTVHRFSTLSFRE